jgi:hypothetical protein
VELEVEDFTAGQTTLKVASRKITKQDKTCSDNQYIFIPFIFDTCTLDFSAPDAIDLIMEEFNWSSITN